ncbi:regulatory protein RecX [Arenimonas sp.]|uniref:regulatory protein RecX n=1 Tax=Arenimonas sp. TaxID=1872635 RepID=UPI0039E34291
MSESDGSSSKSRAPRRPEPSAYQRALGLLVRREHSRRELKRKLGARGISQEETETALSVLAKQDFQNDQRFAEALVRSRALAGYGPLRIRAELSSHGIDRGSIETALGSVDHDWLGSARALARRRFSSCHDDPAQRRKAVDFLMRRGFDQGMARSAIGWAVAGDDSDD